MNLVGFDKTITLYSKRYDKATKKTLWAKMVIHGASWNGHTRVTTGTGLSGNNSYSVRIPQAIMPYGYIPASDWPSANGGWTVQCGDVVVLGVCDALTINGITDITSKYEAFTVTAVHNTNLSLPLPHLRIEGK